MNAFEQIWKSTCSPIALLPKKPEQPEQVPISQKMTLTIREAAAYSGIGVNKLYNLLNAPNCPFVLFVGNRRLVKRKLFEDYIMKQVVI